MSNRHKITKKAFGETQREFAERFNVCLRLVESWEQGHRKIRGPALRLYEVLQKELFS